jgi:hydrogenase-4 component F
MSLAFVILLPVLASLLALLSGARRMAGLITVLAMAGVLALALTAARTTLVRGQVSTAGGWLACDGLGALILVLVAFVGFSAALYSAGYLEQRHPHDRNHEQRAYYPLFNVFVASMLAVPLMANVALLWVALELTTLLSAFLVGFENTPEALEAAWKYALLTTLGAIIALLGVLILYWGTRIAGKEAFTWNELIADAPAMPPTLIWPAFLMILIGFGTKVGLVPMHTWLPDAHSQAPAPICALLSGVETSTALYVILRLYSVLSRVPGSEAGPWFLVFGVLSVGVATILLIQVRDYKRMFAFSTVEHMGIILLAVGLGSADARFAAAYQITAHALAKSFCFFASGIVVLVLGEQRIAAVQGLARRAPIAAIPLLAGALAITGMPPSAIFASELLILKAGLARGDYLVVGFLAFFIVIGFAAIMRHVTRMSFGAGPPGRWVGSLPVACLAALAMTAAPLVIFGLSMPAGLGALLHLAGTAMGR